MKNILKLMLILACCQVTAQSYFGYQISITHENDVFAINNKDENYTGGFNLEGVFPKFKFKQPFFELNNSVNFQNIRIGGTGYTPQDIASESIVEGDRPYASLIYMGFGKTSINEEGKSQLESILYLGVIGSAGPGNVQSYLHENNAAGSTRPVPEGWHNQIGYDGAFVLNYNVRFKKEFNLKYRENQKVELFRPYWGAGVDIGNYMMNLQGGVFFNILNYNSFPVLGVGHSNIPTKKSFDNELRKKKWIRLNVFFNPFLRFVGYNTTLEGKMFNDNSVYKIAHGDVERFLFEFKAGINVLLFERFYIKYTHSARSREFKGGKAMHYWGGVTLGYSPLRWITNKK